MESESNLSAHAVNLLQKIAIQSTIEDEKQFFVPLIPSLPINFNLFNDPSSLIDELKLDEVPQPNPFQWQSQKNKSVSETFQTFLKNPDFEGIDHQNIPKDYDEDIDTQFKPINRKIQTALKNNDVKKVESLQAQKNEFIGENKAQVLGNNIAVLENSKIQGRNQKLNVSVEQDQYFKEFCQNGQVDAKFFKYDSKNEKIGYLNETENQIALTLKEFGLGSIKQNQNIGIPLEKCFSELKIEGEWCKINFKREWIHNHIFQSEHYGIQNEHKYSWSNGTKFQQDETAKLPYLTVGAIVARNIVIQGVRQDNEVLQALKNIENNKQNSYALFFKLSEQDQFNTSEQSVKIELQAPRIIGFILKPFEPFPKFSREPEWFSATINPIDSKQNQIISQETQFFVRFLDKNEKHFKNFENLYKECLGEWKRNNIIDIQLDEGKQNIDEDYAMIVQIKIDNQNQTYTLGSGELLENFDNLGNFNQKFGDHCIKELISKENIDYNLKQKCKKIIMHEIGRIIGLKREQIYDENIEFNKEEVIKFFVENLKQLKQIKNEKFIEQELLKEAQNLAQEQIFAKHHVSNFQNPDKKSIMYIPYPKSWVAKPEDYYPAYNYKLSESDRQLLNQKFQLYLAQTGSNTIDISDISFVNQIEQNDDVINTQQLQDLQQKAQEEAKFYEEILKQQQEAELKRIQEEAEIQRQKEEEEFQQILLQRQLQKEEQQKQKEIEEELLEKQRLEEEERIRNEELERLRIEEQKRNEELMQQEIERKRKEDEARAEAQRLELLRIQQEKEAQRLELLRIQQEKEAELKAQEIALESTKQFIEQYLKDNDLIQGDFTMDEIYVCFAGEKIVIKYEDWKNIVEEVYKQLKLSNKPENPFDDILPEIQTFEQKNVLKNRLEKGQVNDKIPAPILEKVYLGLKLEVIQQYKSFYTKFNIMTNNIQKIHLEEKETCIQFFKNCLKEKKDPRTQFQELKQNTLIHEDILSQLYEEQFRLFEEDDLIISIFEKYFDGKLSKIQISELLFVEDQSLKNLLKKIFKYDSSEYLNVKNALNQKKICLSLLDNEIETFINNVQTGNINLAIKYLKQNYHIDPVLCMKLLYYLSNLKQQQDEEEKKEEIEIVEFKRLNSIKKTTVELLKKKKYQILKTYRNQNIARIIQKGFLLSKEENQEEAFKKQKLFEERQLFGNEKDNNKIKEFLKQYKEKEQQNLQNTFQIFEKFFQDSNLDVKLNDLEFIQTYSVEQQGYDKIMEYLKKFDKDEFEKDLFKFNDDENGEINDIEKIAKYFSTPIIIHSIDNIDEDYKVYGENYFNNIMNVKPVHVVIDNKNEAFHLLQSIDLKIKIDVINSNLFQQQYPQIYKYLLSWMQRFFGYKNLFKFIYDEKQQIHLSHNISVLEDFSKESYKYEADNTEENFRQMQQHCLILENLDQSLFNEWYEQIKFQKSGQSFCEKYDFQRSRQNTKKLVEKLKKIKEQFPDPPKLFDLKDFNRLSCRVDIDTLRKSLKGQKNNAVSFSNEVITQMFGFINRRETISTFMNVLRSLDLPVQVSSRFLISMLLQQSDISLRSRIIHYQSEYYSVPLIINCQSSFEGCNQQIKYVPEIAFNMLEGFGVFNFGAGNRTIMPVGKSQVINDILFPSALFNHEVFEQQDKNLFSAGQVDVFFEKSFDKKRNFVVMDGQGSLKDQAIISCLMLTNIAIIHFQRQDFEDEESLNDLTKKIKQIKNMKNKIKIILLIRDSNESKILKYQFDNQNQYQNSISQQYSKAKSIENDIDFCVELQNMRSLTKKEDRIQQIKIVCKIFYELLSQMNIENQTQNFTKQNFLQKFILSDKTDLSYAKSVIQINEKSEEFVQKVELIKSNIFDEKSLPILDYKNQLRKKLIEIRQNKGLNDMEAQQKLEEKLDNEKNEIEFKLRQQIPSSVLENFKDIVIDPNSSMILQEVSKRLRILTQKNIEEPKKRKEKLIEDQKSNTKAGQIESKDEIDERNSLFKMKIEKIDLEIYQKSISLEYFWRCLVYYLGKDSDYQIYNSPNVKNDVVLNIENQLKNGDCFELIDGENLEFKGLFIQEVIKQQKTDKVIVVCVIGPQSTGKSTLMNFAFGTQFFTSAGRCTKGIYFTLQKIPDTCQVNKISWLLMLDTEGLQSPERIDDEYDRKIVLFAMLSADVLIINSRGEINANMINTLKMCCVTYDALQKYGYNPEIIYTNGQNDRLDKEPFKDQVQDLKSKVIEASDSATIEKVAEQLLGYNDDKINVFGYAYKSEVIEKDDEKGLKENYNFKISNTNFGVETARIYNIVQKTMSAPGRGFKEINMWLEESKENWNVIDRFSASINQFSNLEEYRNDKKVQKYLNQKWMDYLSQNSITEKDEVKCNQKKQELIEIFQKFGQETLEKETNTVEQDNIREKDVQLEKEVFQHFDEWKQLPLQKGITVLSEKRHKSDIRAKMDVIQNEFKIKLRAKIKEEQMLIINQNGHRKVLNRAYQLSNDENFKQEKNINHRNKIVMEEFEKAWKQSIDEIKGEAQIKQMKKSYFDDLQRTFKIFNPFIEQKGELEFQNLLEDVEQTHKNNLQVDSLMQDFLMRILTQTDQNQQLRQLFGFSQDVLLQMVENPKDRLFDEIKNPEVYLNLSSLLNCDYIYTISKDLGNDLDKQFLKQEIYKNLTNMIQKSKKVIKQNYYGNYYQEKALIWVNDEIGQQSYLQLLFQDLTKAGFVIQVSVKNAFFINEIKLEELYNLNLQDIFDQFMQQGESGMNSQKQKWLNQFVDNLHFDPLKFKKLKSRISVYFKSKIVKIQKEITPTIPKQIHIQQNVELNQALIVSDPQIVYMNSPDAKNISKTAISILIAPRSSPQDSVLKWQYLAQIALKQINWTLIVQQIMASVENVLKPQIAINTQNIQDSLNEEKKEDTQEINFDKIMKLTQMDYNQISNLEAEFLNTNLREKINQELYTKLGLFLNHTLKAKISWCALIYSWVKLYKKAEITFNNQLSQLESQKERYQKEFQEIASGSSDLLTSQSSKTLMSELERKYIESVKLKASLAVTDKLAELKPDFDNFKIYEFLDNKYLNPPQSSDFDEFLEYVHNPVKIFENYVEDLKIKKITDLIIIPHSENVLNEIQINISTLQKILNKLNQAVSASSVFQNNNTIENYFYIKNQNSIQILTYEQQQQLSKHVFPVMSYVLRRLLIGEFTMNEFEFKIYDDKKTENFYIFQPKKRTEQGPLEIFIGTQKEIKEIYHNEKNSVQLIEMLIKILELNQYDNNCKMFQINVMIQEMQRKAEEMQNNMQLRSGFDEAWFGCLGTIKTMKDTAVGCKSLCQFCGRKCELTQHQIEVEHTCDKMGHQMRVFKGGFLLNDKGEKYPSLKTCDMIKPDSKIFIDGNQHTWQDLLDKQAIKWGVSYKADDKDLIKKYESFNQFWFFVGKDYCDKNQFKFIQKNNEIDEQAQMHEAAVVVICIDMSGSMSGSRWNNAVKGAKQLIDYIRNHHLDKELVQLVVILFDDESQVVYDENLKHDIPERIWDPKYGGTDFGNPLRDAIQRISQHISKKNQAKIYFFTDGFAPYPQQILEQIGIEIQNNKNNWEQSPGGKTKFECLLMCENTKNATMELIKNKFNSISQSLFGHNDCCKLMEAVDTSKLGTVMIENFKFN